MTPDFETRYRKARRAVIERTLSGLNDKQREAAMTTEGPLLLLAGAGSGKTTVLIRRIATLIRYGCGSDSPEIPDWIGEAELSQLERFLQTDGQPTPEIDALCALRPAAPWSILAITFTNKAANELKQRLAALLGPQAEDVWAMTFHAACCRILRREIERLGYGRSFTIYDTADSERVIKDVCAELRVDEKALPPRLILNLISKAKDRRQSPAELDRAMGDDRRNRDVARVYKEYQRRLREANALDFDDIILLTVQLLEEFEDVRDYYQRKFRYVLIDEYQDTNNLQYQLASLLAGHYENICVVGDDDQSIYKFRGATIDNILNFEHQFRGAKLIRLEQNYRSTGKILEAANAVIRHNRTRKGKKLWTENPSGEPVTEYEAENESAEADYVAGRILSLHRSAAFRDFAVLYRTNAQSNAVERSFKFNGIPYRIIGGTRFYDRAEIKDMVAYLCLINNHADDLRLRRILNVPPRGIGDKTLENVERLASARGCPLFEIIRSAGDYPMLEKSAGKLLRFAELIETCKTLSEKLTLPEFYDRLLQLSGYEAMLSERGDVENRTRLENVRELRSSLVGYEENHPEGRSLAGFLEEVALYTDIDRYDRDADAVVMMTMHAAKGLEFPCVFVVGMEEGLFPSLRSIGEAEEMEEERRLCYVAITRAKRSLTLTHARQRMLYGRTSVNKVSRFVEEIPEQLLDKKGSVRPGPRSFAARPFGADDRPAGVHRPPQRPVLTAPKPKSVAPLPKLSPGMMVEHKAFGRGMITSVQAMGNDALLEVAFDTIGTKRLMARTALGNMKLL